MATGVDFGKIAEAFRAALPPIQKAFAIFHKAIESGKDNSSDLYARCYYIAPSLVGSDTLHAVEGAVFPSCHYSFDPADTLSPADVAEVHSFLASEFGLSVNPSDRPVACQGCQNYHGEVYDGNRLICGIHPYGWNDGDECRDRAEVN